MAFWLCKLKFVNTFDNAIWHENWYLEAPESAEALNRTITYADARVKLLAKECAIKRITVSNVEEPRDVRVWEGRKIGSSSFSTSGTERQADHPDMAMLVRFFATDKIWRHLAFRGVPDKHLGGEDALIGLQSFQDEYELLEPVIIDQAKFMIRHIDQDGDGATITTINLGVFSTTITTFQGHGLEAGNKVLIKKVLGPKLNGIWDVVNITNDKTFTISHGPIEPRVVKKYGECRLLTYDHALIIGGDTLRVTTRRTSQPLVNKKAKRRRRA